MRRRSSKPFPYVPVGIVLFILILGIGFVQYIRNENQVPPAMPVQTEKSYQPIMVTLTEGIKADVVVITGQKSYSFTLGYANSSINLLAGPCFFQELGNNALEVVCNTSQRVGTVIVSPGSATFNSNTLYNVIRAR